MPIEGELPSDGAGEVLLPTDLAVSLNAGLGSTVEILGESGTEEFTVSGLVEPEVLGMLAYENIFVDLSTVQDLFGERGYVTRIDLQLVPGTDPAQWQAQHQGGLPDGLRIQDTQAVTSAFTPLLTVITLVLTAAASVTLLVSALLVSLTVNASVQARRRTFGVLRAMGATGSWLARGVLAELVILGTVSALAGLGVALLLTLGLDALLSTTAGLPQGPLTLVWWHLPLTFAVGLLAALAGGVPALRAVVRMPPMSSVNHPVVTPVGSRGAVVASLAAAVLVVAGTATLATDHPLLKLAGFCSLLAAAGCAAPLALRWVSYPARRLSVRWTAGYAAARTMRNGSLTPTVVMVSAVSCLSASLVMGAAAVSTAMHDQVEKQFGADIQVTSDVSMDGTVASTLARVEGVGLVSPYTSDEASLTPADGGPEQDVSVLAVDPETYFEGADLPWADGDARRARDLLAGGGVLLPASLTELTGTGSHDQVVLSRDGDSRAAEVGGTFNSMITGTQIVIGHATARALGISGASGWDLTAAPGMDVVQLRDRVNALVERELPGLTVITAAEMQGRATSELGTYTSSVFGVVVVALTLGTLGTAGTLAGSVARRECEFGILRAVGARARSIRSIVLWEALLAAVAGLVLGLALGLLAGHLLVQVIGGAMGATLGATVAPAGQALVIAITLGVLLAAGLLPGLRAQRIHPALALRAA